MIWHLAERTCRHAFSVSILEVGSCVRSRGSLAGVRRPWFRDPRFLAVAAHTVFVGIFALSVALTPPSAAPTFGSLAPCFMAALGVLDLPAAGVGMALDEFLLPGFANDFRVFAVELTILGGMQWFLVGWIIARSRARKRKLDPNACVGCGYDLTGNLSGRCPECGMPP